MDAFSTYMDKFGGEKMTNLVNWELFAKIFLANIHKYTENVRGICPDCSLFAKFFRANNFYLYSLPKFPLPNMYFPRTVYYKSTLKVLVKGRFSTFTTAFVKQNWSQLLLTQWMPNL